MTVKQKAARAKFKAIVHEAKKLRAKNPKRTQAQAVKQAWAIDKKRSKKIGDVVVTYPSKKEAEYKMIRGRKGEFKGNSRVYGTKTHKDTKSHNVNIRVVSGVMAGFTTELSRQYQSWLNVYARLHADLLHAKTSKDKNKIRREIKVAKLMISQLKKSLVQNNK
ncbi:MAG: hypothetical protein ACK6DA_06420 [Candidatus Kapaibacterium sp.]